MFSSIHLNPIRAKLVSNPEAYRWSSFCSYLGHDAIAWLKQDRILQKFGTTDLEARQNMIRYTSQIIDAELDVSIVQEEFINQFVDLIAAAQIEFGFNCSEISSDCREKRLVDIRSILALAVQKTPELYLQQVARYLNRDSSSLCRLVKRAKESQDLATKTERLLQVVLSPKKEKTKKSNAEKLCSYEEPSPKIVLTDGRSFVKITSS